MKTKQEINKRRHKSQKTTKINKLTILKKKLKSRDLLALTPNKIITRENKGIKVKTKLTMSNLTLECPRIKLISFGSKVRAVKNIVLKKCKPNKDGNKYNLGLGW